MLKFTSVLSITSPFLSLTFSSPPPRPSVSTDHLHSCHHSLSLHFFLTSVLIELCVVSRAAPLKAPFHGVDQRACVCVSDVCDVCPAVAHVQVPLWSARISTSEALHNIMEWAETGWQRGGWKGKRRKVLRDKEISDRKTSQLTACDLKYSHPFISSSFFLSYLSFCHCKIPHSIHKKHLSAPLWNAFALKSSRFCPCSALHNPVNYLKSKISHTISHLSFVILVSLSSLRDFLFLPLFHTRTQTQ